jgi:hypothetical protein
MSPNWEASATITLQSGDNVITVTASDAAGNSGTAQITVNYSVPGGGGGGNYYSIITSPSTKKCNTLITKNGVRTSYGFGYYGPASGGYNPPEVSIPAKQTVYLMVDPYGFGYGVDVLGSNFKISVIDYNQSHHNLIVTLITVDRNGNDISSSQCTECAFVSAGSGTQQYGAKISGHTNNKIYLIEIREIGGLTIPVSVTWAR